MGGNLSLLVYFINGWMPVGWARMTPTPSGPPTFVWQARLEPFSAAFSGTGQGAGLDAEYRYLTQHSTWDQRWWLTCQHTDGPQNHTFTSITETVNKYKGQLYIAKSTNEGHSTSNAYSPWISIGNIDSKYLFSQWSNLWATSLANTW